MPFLLIGPKYVDGVVPIIESAKHTIDIIMFDWRLYPGQHNQPVMRLTEALGRAVRRGVRVRALMGKSAAIIKLKSYGIETKPLYLDKIVHAKVMCVDQTICILGSHNYTQSAFSRNLEISIMVEAGNIAAEYTTYFNYRWGI